MKDDYNNLLMKRLIMFFALVAVTFFEIEAQETNAKSIRRCARELKRDGWKSITNESIGSQLADCDDFWSQYDSEGNPMYVIKQSYFTGKAVEAALDSALCYARIFAIDDVSYVQTYAIGDVSYYSYFVPSSYAWPVDDSTSLNLLEEHFAVKTKTIFVDSSAPSDEVEIVDGHMSRYAPFVSGVQKCENVILSLWRRKGEDIEVRVSTAYPITEMKETLSEIVMQQMEK